ncbi:MAG: FHA domain-containing protein, partial [Deltaproteobacteria bacterium]|nr:FHA domain-containing protein [Deltaproteobacteria bacterium]
MARLVLKLKDQVIREYPISGDRITIGRKKDNTIAINSLAISRNHARIDKTGTDFVITDLKSTNGIFVNSEKVSSQKLVDGDNILIGKHLLTFHAPQGEVVQEIEPEETDVPETDRSETLALDMDFEREQLVNYGKGVPAGPPVAEVTDQPGMLSLIDGPGFGDIALTAKRTRIGRADGSEIKISGLFIGETAGVIARGPMGYSITFGGGMAKLRVNGRVVKETVTLNELDVITIGSFKFQFYTEEKAG